MGGYLLCLFAVALGRKVLIMALGIHITNGVRTKILIYTHRTTLIGRRLLIRTAQHRAILAVAEQQSLQGHHQQGLTETGTPCARRGMNSARNSSARTSPRFHSNRHCSSTDQDMIGEFNKYLCSTFWTALTGTEHRMRAVETRTSDWSAMEIACARALAFAAIDGKLLLLSDRHVASVIKLQQDEKK
jgi:hypothetical protein